MGGRSSMDLTVNQIPADFPRHVKRVRARLGLTQQALADQLGVAFSTVNRWENGQVRPSPLSWSQLQDLVRDHSRSGKPPREKAQTEEGPPPLDFTSTSEIVSVLAEAERLSFGHLANPTFATETSQIDPLPHQRIAVYDHMLPQDRLRFLEADDAGAGKTIMTGLYIREQLSRRVIRRVLVVCPAGLVGNWQHELDTLFNLSFRPVSGTDARTGNPFVGDGSDQLIVSVDTLAGKTMFSRLQEPDVVPYDLVVFDEAHKLSARQDPDLRIHKTRRYRLAEAIAGVRGLTSRWSLNWHAHHLLLLTATPHMGKDYPYYALWRLLEPDVLSTHQAFREYPQELRAEHFIRRTKEEMVKFDNTPLYPQRVSDTLGYELTQGEVSEQRLYDETTDYLQYVYNKAMVLNRTAARFAMGVFQRRLASSTYALLRSFERRIEKLDNLIADVQEGRLSEQQLLTLQRRLDDETDDPFESQTADEESPEGDLEANEISEDRLLQVVAASSVADLMAELRQVEELRDLAKEVYETPGTESKFNRLRDVLNDENFTGEKFIIFTEHRDTMTYLVRRLEGMGYTGQVAQIHGGMPYTEREEQIERFRKPHTEDGARFLVATDAAGEGINLQFCWIMVNYDIPWNPARLEQRMGRIHRYGQKHDPVVILNLVATSTREGRVLLTLLEKLEAIRKELKSDKVYDVVGRVFQDVSIKDYIERTVTEDDDSIAAEIEGALTTEQVRALEERERALYGTGGDVATQLPRLRKEMEHETYLRLLPGYVRHFIERAAPLVDIAIDGDTSGYFSLRPGKRGAMDPLLAALESYPTDQRQRLSVERPDDGRKAVWLHPGEPVFESLRRLVHDRLGAKALHGAIFVDPSADKPYLFHLAQLSVARRADPELRELAHEDILDCRLIGIRQSEGAEITNCPVEHLLLLHGGHGLSPGAQRLAAQAEERKEQARAYLMERVAREMAVKRRNELLTTLAERRELVRRGFDFHEAELANARSNLAQKVRNGNQSAQGELGKVKRQQKQIAAQRAHALAVLEREPELIDPGKIEFIAHALVVPTPDPAEKERHDADVEQIAMDIARAFEEAEGATVKDVHTPPLARAAGLPDNPGFDLLSIRPDGEQRGIEVKGRAATGQVEVTDNEWGRACNMRDRYWLYVVYDCAAPSPRLVRVPDPFGTLLAKAKGSVLISPRQIAEAAEA